MKLFVEEKEIVFPEKNDMNAADFYAFCTLNPALNMERDASGNILVLEPTGMDSGYYESVATGLLVAWNIKHKLGRTFSSQTGFTLPNGAVRSPDGAWIAKERYEALPQYERERFGRICPDFVLEIRSRSDRLADLQQKMVEYMGNGCRLAFLIDPEAGAAWMYRLGQAPEAVSGFDAVLSGEDVLPGFELPLAAFRD